MYAHADDKIKCEGVCSVLDQINIREVPSLSISMYFFLPTSSNEFRKRRRKGEGTRTAKESGKGGGGGGETGRTRPLRRPRVHCI